MVEVERRVSAYSASPIPFLWKEVLRISRLRFGALCRVQEVRVGNSANSSLTVEEAVRATSGCSATDACSTGVAWYR